MSKKKTINEMIAVMQAAANGKKIEFQPNGYDGWLPCTPSWDWNNCDYRIKES